MMLIDKDGQEKWKLLSKYQITKKMLLILPG